MSFDKRFKKLVRKGSVAKPDARYKRITRSSKPEVDSTLKQEPELKNEFEPEHNPAPVIVTSTVNESLLQSTRKIVKKDEEINPDQDIANKLTASPTSTVQTLTPPSQGTASAHSSQTQSGLSAASPLLISQWQQSSMNRYLRAYSLTHQSHYQNHRLPLWRPFLYQRLWLDYLSSLWTSSLQPELVPQSIRSNLANGWNNLLTSPRQINFNPSINSTSPFNPYLSHPDARRLMIAPFLAKAPSSNNQKSC